MKSTISPSFARLPKLARNVRRTSSTSPRLSDERRLCSNTSSKM